MKIAVFADIHSNFEAFKTCFDKAIKEGATEFIFLGDYLGDMANLRQTMDMVYQVRKDYPCTFIRGNKEDYWLEHRRHPDAEDWAYGRTTTGMLRYNFDRVADEDLDFFESMPISIDKHYEGLPDITFCHGSPYSANQSLRPDYDYIDEVTATFNNDIVICAHFHIQTQYTRSGKLIINPGAIGISLNAGGKAQFMILEGENGAWDYHFYSVDYDVDATIKAMHDEKINELAPGWYRITKHLLQTGENSHASILRKVMSDYYKETGIETLHGIPEEFWEKELDTIFGKEETR